MFARRLLARRFASASKQVDEEPLLRPARKAVELPPLTLASLEAINTVCSIPFGVTGAAPKAALPASLLRSFAELNSAGLLVREQTKELWQLMLGGSHMLLEGPRGIGKSSTLLQLACTAVASGQYLVLYAPSVARWTAGYYPYVAAKQPGQFDQPELAREILTMFGHLNAAVLPQVPAMAALLKASDPISSLGLLIEALRSQTRFKILLALDQVNALYAHTQYRDEQGTTLFTDQFSVMAAIKDCLATPSNLTVVGAHCNVDPLVKDYDYAQTQMASRRVTLKPFNHIEVTALLAHLNRLGHSYKQSSRYSHLVQFVSGGIPANVVKACNYESIYTR